MSIPISNNLPRTYNSSCDEKEFPAIKLSLEAKGYTVYDASYSGGEAFYTYILAEKVDDLSFDILFGEDSE